MLTKLYVKLHSDEGATAAEYGVLLALVVIAIAAGATVFGRQMSEFFSGIFGRIPLGG